jgi:hypothetical protein
MAESRPIVTLQLIDCYGWYPLNLPSKWAITTEVAVFGKYGQELPRSALGATLAASRAL